MLLADRVVMHSMVLGEIALGNLSRRQILEDLGALPRVESLPDEEVTAFVERHLIFGRGIGFIDAHLLASCAGSRHQLWTRDRRLASLAEEFGLRYSNDTLPPS